MPYIAPEFIRNTSDALAYLTECTLATAQDLRRRSRPPKGELDRQTQIAQWGVHWVVNMDAKPTGRVASVIESGGTVAEWIESEAGEQWL